VVNAVEALIGVLALHKPTRTEAPAYDPLAAPRLKVSSTARDLVIASVNGRPVVVSDDHRPANETKRQARKQTLSGEAFVAIRQLCNQLDVHSTTIWRWVNAGTFPAPIYFGTRRRWKLTDVERWCSEQAAKKCA
jgi:excisionase family DNA binding protein